MRETKEGIFFPITTVREHMIQLHFTIGRRPCRRAAPRQRQRRLRTCVESCGTSSRSVSMGPVWYILPYSDERSQYHTTLQTISDGITGACTTLLNYRSILDTDEARYSFRICGCTPAPFGIDDAFLLGLNDCITLNQRVRWAMKRLIHGWRIRRLRIANTEDFGTLELPKQCVNLYDWATGTRYQFEASSIFHDIKERLYRAEYLFPRPLMPRNPFTNLPLTLGQTHFLLQELLRIGYADTALLSFRDVGYNLLLYTTTCNGFLRAAAVRRLFRAPSSSEYHETLYEFIQSQYEYHGIPWIASYVWRWMITTQESDLRIQRWKQLCYRYYAALCMEPEATREDCIERVYEKTAELTAMPVYEMISLYKRRGIE